MSIHSVDSILLYYQEINIKVVNFIRCLVTFGTLQIDLRFERENLLDQVLFLKYVTMQPKFSCKVEEPDLNVS